MRIVAVTTSVLALALWLAPAGAEAATASARLPLHATVQTSATATECSNSPGPFISLEGSISLGTIDARLRFSNNLRGTHERTEDVVTTVNLLTDEPIRFAKQPPEGGVGGNPYVFLQFTDCATGEAVGNAVKLGRCVQGLSVSSVDVAVEALANATVTGGSCENSPGPFISLNGEISLSGVCATLIFTNNARFTHVHEEDVTVGLSILPEGQSIVFAKQPPEGGVGGNPHIFLQFLVDGEPAGTELYLGRCVHLGD